MYQRLRRILAQHAGISEAEISPDTRVGDLIDSLGLVEVTLVLEEELVAEGKKVQPAADWSARDSLQLTVREFAEALGRITG